MTSSEGKTEVVTPSSAPMFAMVARLGTSSVARPGPKYSKTFPTFPFEPKRRNTARMTSLAETPGWSLPVRRIPTTFGQAM